MPESPPASHSRTATVTWLHRVGVVAGAVVVWVSWLYWPQPPTTGLDASWQLVLGYAREHAWQFGTEFVFTHGPWSFLNTIHSYPDSYWPKVVWQVCFKALVAGAVGVTAFQLPVWRGALLLAAAVLLLPAFEDVAPVLLILFVTHHILVAPRQSLVIFSACAALFAFFALQKFTYAVMVVVACAGTAVLLLLRRRTKDALGVAGAFVLFVCFFWMAAGQNLTALPLFLRRSWQLASLYPEVMYYQETAGVFWCGIATLTAGVLAIVLAVRRCRDNSRLEKLLLAALAFAFAFLIWKQGFVRADGHVVGFFLCALGVGLAVRPAWSGSLLAALGLLGFSVSNINLLAHAPASLTARVEAGLRGLVSPAALHRQYLRHLEAATHSAALPNIRERVGDEPVDIFGDDHAFGLLNGLHYTPRPVFQTHQAYSPALAELNATHYFAETAPQHVLLRLQTIDGRFLPGDDARLLLVLLRDYRPAVDENGWWLLERQTTPQSAAFTVVTTRDARLGRRIPVPESPDSFVIATIDVRPTLLGRVRTFFYKPADVELIVDDGSVARRFRLIRPAAAGGFLVSPLLRDPEDFRAFVNDAAPVGAKTLVVDIAPEARKFYRSKFKISFAMTPKVPAAE